MSHLDMDRVEAPKVDQDDHVGPEVSKHLGDHPQGPGKGRGKPGIIEN